jgi:hypothetical protein
MLKYGAGYGTVSLANKLDDYVPMMIKSLLIYEYIPV